MFRRDGFISVNNTLLSSNLNIYKVIVGNAYYKYMDVLAAKWHSTFGMNLDNTRLDILDSYPMNQRANNLTALPNKYLQLLTIFFFENIPPPPSATTSSSSASSTASASTSASASASILTGAYFHHFRRINPPKMVPMPHRQFFSNKVKCVIIHCK